MKTNNLPAIPAQPANVSEPLDMDSEPIPFTLTRCKPRTPNVNDLTGLTVSEVMADYNTHRQAGLTIADDEPKVIRSGLTRQEALDGLAELCNMLSEGDDVHPTIVGGRALVACVGDADDPEAPISFGVEIWITPNADGTWDMVECSKGCGRLPWLLGCGWTAA